MKKIKNIKSLLIIATIFILQSCSTPNERHIGEWKGTDEGKTVSLILDKSNYAVFVSDNQVIGGKDFQIAKELPFWSLSIFLRNVIGFECKYEIDYSKNPILLDLVIYEQGKTQEKGRLKGIIRFITDNKIEYRGLWPTANVPEVKDITIVLDKVTN